MNVPGSNLLMQALSLISAQSFQYIAFQSRLTNSIGYDVNTYAAPITIQGSIQPVPRSLYDQYGLQIQKNYIWVYTPNAVVDIDRDRSSDKVIFNSNTYQILSDTLWYPLDGWTAAIAIQVPS